MFCDDSSESQLKNKNPILQINYELWAGSSNLLWQKVEGFAVSG